MLEQLFAKYLKMILAHTLNQQGIQLKKICLLVQLRFKLKKEWAFKGKRFQHRIEF